MVDGLPDVEAFAAEVAQTLNAALSPVWERLAAAEALLKQIGDLRDRVVMVETKAAIPVTLPPPVDLSPVLERLTRVEARPFATKELWEGLTDTIVTLRERVAVLEVRPSLPGPPGEPGPAGKDGTNGLDGKDGTAGLSFEGVYQEGKSYEFGHLVTWGGSSWHCNESTTTKPGDGSKAWTLMVKRGRDGKDGRDAEALPVVRTR